MNNNINFNDKIFLEINHKIFPNDDKANNLFKFITLDNINNMNTIVMIILKYSKLKFM